METAVTSGLVILLAGSATVTAWAIANEQVIQAISGPLAGIPLWSFLLMLNILLLINGMFMDDYASVIVLGPILAPIAWALGWTRYRSASSSASTWSSASLHLLSASFCS